MRMKNSVSNLKTFLPILIIIFVGIMIINYFISNFISSKACIIILSLVVADLVTDVGQARPAKFQLMFTTKIVNLAQKLISGTKNFVYSSCTSTAQFAKNQYSNYKNKKQSTNIGHSTNG